MLKPVIKKKFYKHFIYLFVAVYTLSSPRLYRHYTDYAKELLELFVSGCVDLYDPQFVVYNVHNLVHMADDVKKFGHLDNISGYPFENFLGQLKRSVRKPQHIVRQISNRIHDGYFKPKFNQPKIVANKKSSLRTCCCCLYQHETASGNQHTRLLVECFSQRQLHLLWWQK